MSQVLVTGAAGFVGRPLIERLRAAGHRVVALDLDTQPSDLEDGIEWVRANLMQPERYASSLRGIECVLHLAAVTGKAPTDRYQRDVDATRVLLRAAEDAGVKRFVLVSSIAVRFEDRRYYPYAASKLAAEQLVKASRLQTAIVRPTMIFGPSSPIQASLERLARLPVIPLFGSGDCRVQPVELDDVVTLLVALQERPVPAKTTIEIGGARTHTMRELLAELRAIHGRTNGARFVRLPLQLLRHALAFVEPVLLPLLPFTAGQLASFANDSVAECNALVDRLVPNRRASPVALS